MCSAARGAVRNAKQKKAVPAKNSKANFWRPRFTWPLRAGKRANANFACSEGFFCAQCAAPCAGLAAFSKPAAVWPVGFCARCPGVFSASAACARGILWRCLSCSSTVCRGHRLLAAFSRAAQRRSFPFSAVLRCFFPGLCAACCFCEGFHACRLVARSVLLCARLFSLVFSPFPA